MNRRFIVILIMTFLTNVAFSQKTVTGVVIMEEENLTFPGVLVKEKGTENFTMTDSTGTYIILVKDSASILTFAFIGYVTREILVEGKSEINTTLKQALISEAWDQKLRFFINSGLLENPFGGQFEFAIPTPINALSLYGNCSYQSNLKGNNYFDAGLRLNGVRLFYSSGFSFGLGIESNYLKIRKNSNTLEALSFESLWWSSLPIDFIVGYTHVNNGMTIGSLKNGIILGAEFPISKQQNIEVKTKVAFLSELIEFQAEIRKLYTKLKRIQYFVKYHYLDSYSELSIGIGLELTYYFKYQRNEY